ncbi:ECF transporter S component [Lactiplantibacillus modestisalitolerans]|uniref:ECF transporter S component n=1 Tax=Lactiplantibacillus modestisalitolerans TaxID=1457219 RepID=A0ABV5WXN3_9LACO|nr:ECF transporter S component [Lactiplantibacillus modestisalitolerans]
MKSVQLKKVVFAGLFAAIILIGISVIRIPLPAIVGRPFIHFGNILTVIAVMLLGFGYGAAAGAIGLGLFDLLNGYAATAWLTVIEAIILAAMVSWSFRLVHYSEDRFLQLYWVSLVAGITKIVTSWCTGVIEALMVGTTLNVAMIGAFTSLLAATINSIACFILVPLIYRMLTRVGFSRQRLSAL